MWYEHDGEADRRRYVAREEDLRQLDPNGRSYLLHEQRCAAEDESYLLGVQLPELPRQQRLVYR